MQSFLTHIHTPELVCACFMNFQPGDSLCCLRLLLILISPDAQVDDSPTEGSQAAAPALWPRRDPSELSLLCRQTAPSPSASRRCRPWSWRSRSPCWTTSCSAASPTSELPAHPWGWAWVTPCPLPGLWQQPAALWRWPALQNPLSFTSSFIMAGSGC